MSYAQLLQQFEKAHADAHKASAAGEPQPEKLGQRFHEVWPRAIPVLQALQKTASVVPGLSTAAPVLSGLIAVGNAIAAHETA